MAERYVSAHTGPQIDEGVRRAMYFTTDDTDAGGFEITDGNKNVVLRITNNGHILTKAFNSEAASQSLPITQIGRGLDLANGILSIGNEIWNLARINTVGSGLDLTSGTLTVEQAIRNIKKIYTIGNGLTFSSNTLGVDTSITDTLSALVKINNIGAGLIFNDGTLSAKITEVFVDNRSVLDGSIAKISMPVHVNDTAAGAYEVADDAGNVVFRITTQGHILTKEFNSEAFIGGKLIRIIGNGLEFNESTGQLKVIDAIFNALRITNIGAGLTFSGGALSANITNVMVDNVSVLDGTVAKISMPVKTSTGVTGAFEIVDESGNVVFMISNTGHVVSQNFNSEDWDGVLKIKQFGDGLSFNSSTGVVSAQSFVSNSSTGAFEISDTSGRVAFRITDTGHIVSKSFNSEIFDGVQVITNFGQGVQYMNGTLKVVDELFDVARIYTIGSGLVLSNGTLSANVTQAVSDVRIDGQSVVTNTIANITMPVRTTDGDGAFELADDAGNVALQITSEGHIKTKEFDSSNINILPPTINDRYLHTNTITGDLEWSEVQGGGSSDFQVVNSLPTPSANAPKVVYSLLDGRLYILDMGGSSSSIVGIGLVGYMIVG